MRLGFLLTKKQTRELITIAEEMGLTPYETIDKAINTMYKVAVKDEKE